MQCIVLSVVNQHSYRLQDKNAVCTRIGLVTTEQKQKDLWYLVSSSFFNIVKVCSYQVPHQPISDTKLQIIKLPIPILHKMSIYEPRK
jgi:hypothetical protein